MSKRCALFLYIYCIFWTVEQWIITIFFQIQGKAKKVVQAQKLWFSILEAQIETGSPYMLFKVHNLWNCSLMNVGLNICLMQFKMNAFCKIN